MELDLQRFYNINRRVVMWVAFFAILFLLRDFFALMFLTFIFGFVMRKVARVITYATRTPYWAAVVVPYLILIALLVLLVVKAIPRVVLESAEFSRELPDQLNVLAGEIKNAAERHGLAPALTKYLRASDGRPADEPTPVVPSPEGAFPSSDAAVKSPPPTTQPISPEAIIDKIEELIVGFLPGSQGRAPGEYMSGLVGKFVAGVVDGTFTFLLAVLLSFLIVLDFDKIRQEMSAWQESPVGRFFHEASRSVVNFSEVVGTAFQCQLMVAALNTVITCVGLVILDIQPVLLLTTIVFLFGLIPVLGVWISSAPIVLIAFNDFGWERAVLAVGLITIVHLLEAYVFNPRIYAARFHLNPVVVLIILLVGHKLFGVWGMLLGIPVTYYVLNIAQVPALPRKIRGRKNELRQPTKPMQASSRPPALGSPAPGESAPKAP